MLQAAEALEMSRKHRKRKAETEKETQDRLYKEMLRNTIEGIKTAIKSGRTRHMQYFVASNNDETKKRIEKVANALVEAEYKVSIAYPMQLCPYFALDINWQNAGKGTMPNHHYEFGWY